MARVEIVPSLEEEINKKFKGESVSVLQQLKSLEERPHKGKTVGNVGDIVIRELRHKGFRFYFITEGKKLRCYDEKTLVGLLLRFVRMSDKKTQQKTREEIRAVLRIIGPSGLT